MTKIQKHIDKFFSKSSFTSKELSKLMEKVKSLSKGRNINFIQNKIKYKLWYFKKSGQNYKRRSEVEKEYELSHKTHTSVDYFLAKNFNGNNLKLAKNLKLSFSQLKRIANSHNIYEFEKDGMLSKEESLLLYDFLESRISFLNRRENKINLDKRKKPLKITSKLDRKKISAGVYDKIRKQDGLGKLIYNAMRK